MDIRPPHEEPERKQFIFDMAAPDDVGQGFRVIDLPKKEEPPTPKPTPQERAATVAAAQRSRGRRSFLTGLLVGQLFIVGVVMSTIRSQVSGGSCR